jgi:hypothetical protein
MRGALAGRRMAKDLMLQRISEDPLGTVRLGAMQQLEYEDP